MPNIPLRLDSSPLVQHTLEAASTALAKFFQRAGGKALILSGAGISVDSGIRAYRGVSGSYVVNKTYRPIFYHEFVAEYKYRQRYWARSFLGYPPVRVAQPNPSHYAVAALHHLGFSNSLITQNVDRLHHKAFDLGHVQPRSAILELHGSLKHVVCLNCKQLSDRDLLQDKLSELNPDWHEYALRSQAQGEEPKSNPDGDVDLQGRSYDSFALPDCTSCGSGPLKPAVTFFGENVSETVKKRSHALIDEASALLIVGSSLATYSAFRLVRAAKERQIPISLLSIGPSRGDPLVNVDLRFEMFCTPVLKETARLLSLSSRAQNDSKFRNLLTSGVIRDVDTFQRYPAAS